jgi:hypothetical protein
MTEAEWLGNYPPNWMLDFVHGFLHELSEAQPERRCRSVERMDRLFGAACCRRIWPLIADEIQDCVEVAERFADDQATIEELRAAQEKALAKWIPSGGGDFGAKACERVCAGFVDADYVSRDTINAAIWPKRIALGFVDRTITGAELATDKALVEAEVVEHRRLLRDIFGNPFRPVTFSPSWQTDTAVSLARTMYDSREFSAMPILADALQDAGCDNDDILSHCRGNGPHVRGCWVVDLVLGKE